VKLLAAVPPPFETVPDVDTACPAVAVVGEIVPAVRSAGAAAIVTE
jgi:hypothetical protein